MQDNNIGNIGFCHITAIDNLLSIVNNKGLLSDSETKKNKLSYASIGYSHIKQRRMEKPVPLWPNVMVGDFVPFYFTRRSPMLYLISKKNSDLTYQNGGEEIIYLVSHFNVLLSNSFTWCFTDRNAADILANFYNKLDDLNRIDWKAVSSLKWGNNFNPKDPGFISRKQAEVLVYKFFPWDWIHQIIVHDDRIKERVERLLDTVPGSAKQVYVDRSWYYD